MRAPLQGLKVVELARVLAGPWSGQTLADLGATVVKIEGPNGDETRHWGPPYATLGDEQVAAYFLACNRGKHSVVADFNRPQDLRRVRRLIDAADVVIENFKVGGLAKFGLDYDSCAQRNRGLVYCSITGFGHTGPYAERAGYDFLVQAMSGLMDITGEPDGSPQKVGVAFADIFTGLYAVVAIQAALAERRRSGEGQHIDMSLFDCLTGVLANQALNYLTTGVAPKRLGNVHPNIAPYAAFPASDGDFIITVGNDRQFRRLCGALELPGLAEDERFCTNARRVENRDELTRRLAERTRRHPRGVWLQRLLAAAVPAAPINTVAEVFADAQIRHRGLQVSSDGAVGVRTPINFSRSSLRLDKRPPKLGEDGDGFSFD